ncbi:MAG: glycogen/starch/alpha-glucan phosphorylase [Oscillospiraceae bacterium]|nr:glycogen/starch/alpha-glucan phosphorylase [Oscillospiraceae bacterium]
MNCSVNELKNEIVKVLKSDYGYDASDATILQMYGAVLMVVQQKLLDKRGQYLDQLKRNDKKRIYYMSMEFLVGRSLKNNLYNMSMEAEMKEAVSQLGFDLEEIYEMEPDAGLGNGGLGRLASCYMDAATTMGYPITGFSIRYEFGIFKQKIVDGWQMEFPDDWLEMGGYWLVPRRDEAKEIHFDGEVKEEWSEKGLKTTHLNYYTVRAVPYDLLISGKDSDAVNSLRLWSAESVDSFDMGSFARGEHVKSMESGNRAEAISKVLYPADDHIEGKSLRLKQQYFFVSASLQNIIQIHLRTNPSLDNLADKAIIHINDTHPALCVPELMRLLMDDYGYEWDQAWDITCNTLAYTNHTVMSEALEKWDVSLFRHHLPRVYSICEEINRRFCAYVFEHHPEKRGAISSMAAIDNNQVRMANLCMIACFSVNGVSKLHSDILKTDLFRDYNDIFPGKLTNVTNGITARRWLCQGNPLLTEMITGLIGSGFEKDLSELQRLNAYADVAEVLRRLGEINLANKQRLARYIAVHNGIRVDPNSLFDVQVKRLHEYKRQLMNALLICHLYLEIKLRGKTMEPRTFIFGAKASPGYYMAKEIIRFICTMGDMINRDPSVNGMLKVVFLENYRVSLAEIIYPAAEISEQISQAGKEASGTGNMKMMLNGALTLGTMDGANVEIYDAVGQDNIFIFGMNAAEVVQCRNNGYNPWNVYSQNGYVKEVLDFIQRGGIDGKNFDTIVSYLLHNDQYMSLADFDSYRLCQQKVNDAYRDPMAWNRMSLRNIAESGIFSADRSIQDYVDQIWYR